jgi:AraC-like DNA-binding protein
MVDWRTPLTIQILHCGEATLQRWRHTPMAEPFWRLYWNADCGWSITHGKRLIALGPERVVLVPAELVFTAEGPQPSRHLFIHFTLAGMAGSPEPVLHELPLDPGLLGLLELARVRHHPDEPWRLQASATALACAALGRLPGDAIHVARLPPVIANAVAHLERNLHRTVPNEELAGLTGMHPNAFIRRFRAELGVTPQRHHLRLRIDHAAAELLHSEIDIDQLAADHGFCDRHHFTRAFARLRHVPPARYRVLAHGGN